jgi:hypothetical protein
MPADAHDAGDSRDGRSAGLQDGGAFVDRPDRLRLVLALDGVRLTEPLGYVELSALARPARGACAINSACSICRRAA